MKIKPIKLDNLHRIAEIQISCKREDYKHFLSATYLDGLNHEEGIKWRKEFLFSETEDIRKGYAVWEKSDIVGYIVVSIADDIDSKSGIEINELFVLKKFRGKYLSYMLLLKALESYPDIYNEVVIYTYELSKANSYYKNLKGSILRQDIQKAGGEDVNVNIFSWERKDLENIINEKLKK